MIKEKRGIMPVVENRVHFRDGLECIIEHFLTLDTAIIEGNICLKICDEDALFERILIRSGMVFLRPKNRNNSYYKGSDYRRFQRERGLSKKKEPNKNKSDSIDMGSDYTYGIITPTAVKSINREVNSK